MGDGTEADRERRSAQEAFSIRHDKRMLGAWLANAMNNLEEAAEFARRLDDALGGDESCGRAEYSRDIFALQSSIHKIFEDLGLVTKRIAKWEVV